MVNIPKYDNYDVTDLNTTESYSKLQSNPDQFGAGVGDAMQRTSGVFGQLSDTAMRIKQDVSRLNVEDKFSNETLGQFRELDKEFMSQMGKNAVNAYDSQIENLRAIKERTLSEISDPMERREMETLLGRRMQQSVDAYDRHYAGQLQVYNKDVYDSNNVQMAMGAVDNWRNPEVSNQYLRTSLANTEARGLELGKPLEWVQLEQRKTKDSVYGTIAGIKANENPLEALSYLTDLEKKGDISPEIASDMRKKVLPVVEALEIDNVVRNAVNNGVITKTDEQTVSLSVFNVKNPAKGVVMPEAFKPIFADASEKYRVDKKLLTKISEVESTFNPHVVSPDGAYGLMQLMPKTAQWLGLSKDERRDPQKNVEAGARYMRFLLDRYDNNEALALAGYNAGQGTVDKAIEKAGGKGATVKQIFAQFPHRATRETIPYVAKILDGFDEIQNQPFNSNVNKGAKVPSSQISIGVSKPIDTGTAGASQDTEGMRSTTTQRPSIVVPLPMAKTKEEADTWYIVNSKQNSIQNAGDKRDKIQSKLKTQYDLKVKEINIQKASSQSVVYRTISDVMQGGDSFDIGQLVVSDLNFRNAFQSLPPKEQMSLNKLQMEQYDIQDRQVTRESEDRRYLIIAEYGEDKSKWLNLDVDTFDLLPKDKALLVDKKLEFISGDNKQDDVIYKNKQRATNIFNDRYEINFQTPIRGESGVLKNPAKAKKYYQTLGKFNQLIDEAVKANGGEAIDEMTSKQMSDKVMREAYKVFSTYNGKLDAGYIGNEPEVESGRKSLADIAYNLEKEGFIPAGTPVRKSFQAIENSIQNGIVNPIQVKRFLTGG